MIEMPGHNEQSAAETLDRAIPRTRAAADFGSDDMSEYERLKAQAPRGPTGEAVMRWLHRILCRLTGHCWAWRNPQWHSDAKRFGQRCLWCGEFKPHPWFRGTP